MPLFSTSTKHSDLVSHSPRSSSTSSQLLFQSSSLCRYLLRALLSEYIVSLSLFSNNGNNSELFTDVEQREDHAQVSASASALHCLPETRQHDYFQLGPSNVWFHHHLSLFCPGLTFSLCLLFSDIQLVPSVKLS